MASMSNFQGSLSHFKGILTGFITVKVSNHGYLGLVHHFENILIFQTKNEEILRKNYNSSFGYNSSALAVVWWATFSRDSPRS